MVICHSVTILVTERSQIWNRLSPEDSALMKLDLMNAFNYLRKDFLLEAARDIQELSRPAHAVNSNRALLSYGSKIILPEEGNTQLSLVPPPIIIKLRSVLRIEYLEDLSLGGSQEADIRLIA